ncbi:MAG: hypothetical protein PHT99_02460 [Methanoregula sp.]|nr:hypothetical protein [Methanoregula sp.]
MKRKQGVIRRALSLLEGPVDSVQTWAKAWNMKTGLDLTQDPARNFRAMRNLRNIYLQGSYIAEGVDLFPLYAIGNGYELEIDEELGDGEEKKKEVQAFLDRINFYDVMWQLMVDAETVRDGVAEIVMGRGSLGQVPVNVVPRPAECFEFDTDQKGRITTYTQVCDNRGNSITKITLNPERVLHYQFLSRTDSPYGISIVERVVHDIKRDTKVTEAITAGICLHGTPKWHIKANSTTPDAPQMSTAERDTLETEFKDFNAKDQFLTEGDVQVVALDTAGVQNVQMYSDVALTRVVAGMGIPGELLGLRQGTTDATAVTRVGAFFKKIKSCQRDVEQMWNTQIIDKITGVPGLIKMKLSDTDPQDFAKMAGAIAQLRTGSDPDAVAPADWCREQLGVPEDERTPEEKPQRQEFPAGFGFGQQGPQEFIPKEAKGEPEDAALNELAAAAHALSEAVRGG